MDMMNYKNLIVWQKSMVLVIQIYQLTKKFPNEEQFALKQQIHRSVVSIPSNIAEGRRRGSTKDFRKFLYYAYRSGAELETQLEIAQRLNYFSEAQYYEILTGLEEIMRMLNKLINKYM